MIEKILIAIAQWVLTGALKGMEKKATKAYKAYSLKAQRGEVNSENVRLYKEAESRAARARHALALLNRIRVPDRVREQEVPDKDAV